MTFMVFHTPLTTPPCHIINKALISSFMTGTRLFKKHRGEKHYTNFPGKADWFNLYEGDLQGCDWCRFGADLDRPFQSWKPFSHSAPWGFFLSEEKTIGAKNTTFFHIWIRETETNKIRRFFQPFSNLILLFSEWNRKTRGMITILEIHFPVCIFSEFEEPLLSSRFSWSFQEKTVIFMGNFSGSEMLLQIAGGLGNFPIERVCCNWYSHFMCDLIIHIGGGAMQVNHASVI